MAVFATGDAAREAEEAGADVVGADDLVARVEGGFLDFDVAIATPDLMGQVGQLGRTLGPRGVMPNPKTGTVTTDIGKTVARVQGGQGRVPHATATATCTSRSARSSFDADALLANFQAVLDEILRAKPAAAKGRYIKAVTTVVDDGPGRPHRPRGGSRRGAHHRGVPLPRPSASV